ncbi:MAG: NAD(P)/FAD-dependent oxidoreductase [Clostridiales bacterium]|nr:NAD(P)/FAD-dependent oxidoreductase [Clostridiales bacterium]
MTYTAIIIGGGVVGALTARALAKYSCSVLLVEKNSDVAAGSSKANSGVAHAGFDAAPGSNKAVYNVLGSRVMESVCEELDVHYKRNGSMVLAFSEDETAELRALLRQGTENGVGGLSIISGSEARALEPALSGEVKSALLAETGGILCPYSLAANAAECAALNGAAIIRGAEAADIRKEGGCFTVAAALGTFKGKYVINAAGLYADKISRAAGDDSIHITPRRGEYMLFDKKLGGLVSHTIFQTPHKVLGKGVLVTPTVDGNLLIGPNALNLDDGGASETTLAGQTAIWELASKSVPCIKRSGLITSFAGLRAVADEDDFIIGWSKAVPGLLNAAGIQSPGLTASPAIAEYLAGLIVEAEGGLGLNPSFNPCLEKRPAIPELSEADLNALIEKNAAYGNIVCRCETVSEGHISEAIRRDCGAVDIDGVKRRTRAGMGRCQGGFCMPRVLEILARETGRPFTEMTKKGDGSYILSGKR